jgi:hypothetical protein
MKFLRCTVLLLTGLAATQAWAWGNHSLAAYRAFERMPEVATASTATVEPLEVFLRAEEGTLEALLAAQEAWAVAHLEKYPPRPAALAFTANPVRSDEARRQAFLMALRVATNSRFALYFRSDPWNPLPGTALAHHAVNTLPESPGAGDKYLALKPGDQVSALTVLATATDEPDYGLDINLWEDSPADWGGIYEFGPQPFGNPALAYSSQAPFHMGFMHESRMLYLAAPFIRRTFPLLRSHQFSTLASLAFRTGHAYWGWRFAGMSLHYLQDLTQPYHAALAPGYSSLKLLSANALSMAGLPGMKNDLVVLLSNRHLALEKYQAELMLQAAARQQETPLEKALHNQDKDKSYPDWSDRYLRDVVSAQAARAATPVSQTILAALPPAYVSDPGFDFGAREADIKLLGEVSRHDPQDLARLDMTIAELLGNFGAHSRNALRGILRVSGPP